METLTEEARGKDSVNIHPVQQRGEHVALELLNVAQGVARARLAVNQELTALGQ